MLLIKPLKSTCACLTLAALMTSLVGCHPFVKYPHPAIISKQAAVGAAAGTATGAIIGAAGVGAGAGALAGLGIATYLHSPPYWLKKLQRENVQVIQIGQKVKIVMPVDKLFDYDSDVILPESYPMLTDVMHFVENYGRTRITINGYTDNVGSPLRALKLSHEQAKSVLAFFWSHGIPSQNLRAIGHGQANPIADNMDSIGSAYNRRIEITFAYG